MFFKHFANKNQLPGFYIIGTLVENGLIVSIRSVFSALLSFVSVSVSTSEVGSTLGRIVEDSDVGSSGWIVGCESTFNSVGGAGSAEVYGSLVANSTTDGRFGVVYLKYDSNFLVFLFGGLLKLGSVLGDVIYVLNFLLWLTPVVLGLSQRPLIISTNKMWEKFVKIPCELSQLLL